MSITGSDKRKFTAGTISAQSTRDSVRSLQIAMETLELAPYVISLVRLLIYFLFQLLLLTFIPIILDNTSELDDVMTSGC